MHIKALQCAIYSPDGPCSTLPTGLPFEVSELYKDTLCTPRSNLAVAIRTWETLLARYPCPFFLLRVADARASGGYWAGALNLYEQLQTTIGKGADPPFDKFLEHYRVKCRNAEQEQSCAWSAGDIQEKWSSSDALALPDVPEPSSSPAIQGLWRDYQRPPQNFSGRYYKYLCVQTNTIEEVFDISSKSIQNLVRTGFYTTSIDEIHESSRLENTFEIIAILKDTHSTLRVIVEQAFSDKGWDVRWLMNLHIQLLNTCNISAPVIRLASGVRYESSICYLPRGATRSVSRKNVIIRKGDGIVQFCPFELVDAELENIFIKFKELLLTYPEKPFALASWIHMAIVSCHPFEDGNGRIARLLASLPLIRAGLPPLCIPRQMKLRYHHAISIARTKNNYRPLVDMIEIAMTESMKFIEALRPSETEDNAILDALEFRIQTEDDFPMQAFKDVPSIVI